MGCVRLLIIILAVFIPIVLLMNLVVLSSKEKKGELFKLGHNYIFLFKEEGETPVEAEFRMVDTAPTTGQVATSFFIANVKQTIVTLFGPGTAVTGSTNSNFAGVLGSDSIGSGFVTIKTYSGKQIFSGPATLYKNAVFPVGSTIGTLLTSTIVYG